LAQVGLVPDRLALIEKDMIHEGPQALAGWVRTTWLPYTERVPETLRESFVDEIIATYLASQPPDSDGRTHVRMVRLEVHGHRR
jgi:trans-aconitate methyltransferase